MSVYSRSEEGASAVEPMIAKLMREVRMFHNGGIRENEVNKKPPCQLLYTLVPL